MIEKIKVRELRDFVRFLTVVLLVPWFGWFTQSMFGVEIEFEVEVVTFISFIVFGSFWCGWLCPFGNLSYFVERIGRSLFPSVQVLPQGKWDRRLRFLKYIFLAGFIYLIIFGGYDYFFGNHVEIYKGSALSFTFLKMKKYMIIMVPLVIPRFFCKYACPQKAMYNIIHRFIPSLAIQRDTKRCVSCGRCNRECPMKIEVSKKERICGEDCISCFNCVDGETCPSKIDALSLDFMGKEVDVRRFSVGVLLIYFIATYIALKLVH
ncbi:hypothetical protein PM10SUCC1_07230 [Propionigenium maris DSM 9537]|uniref:4Fe-4S ferredoxin-type domain-containing protein n=1 Tax=Propionigenium maris DSM 9537 TaxID=1123000 RepID=A0A9W6GH91_9FUSO|nr:4Fe-4S binding protein [Propionigenium maris]GLI55208.1 hypothetical protein PM10SUCC1_07230 [Propionigenium maris DSM 9537]